MQDNGRLSPQKKSKAGLASLLQGLFNLQAEQYSELLTVEQIANWDSLKHMELITELESEYGVTFEMLEIIHMQSVQNIIDTLTVKGVEFS